MTLSRFSKHDYAQLISWINSEELNYLWGGPTYDYPLTNEQITDHCQQKEVSAFMLKLEGKNAGFIELFHVANNHYRICRVFIDNKFRGQGLAKDMITSLLKIAKNDLTCDRISLAVFEHNEVAKKCYQSLGFNIIATELGTRSFKGKMWNLVRMEKSL